MLGFRWILTLVLVAVRVQIESLTMLQWMGGSRRKVANVSVAVSDSKCSISFSNSLYDHEVYFKFLTFKLLKSNFRVLWNDGEFEFWYVRISDFVHGVHWIVLEWLKIQSRKSTQKRYIDMCYICLFFFF